MFSSKILSCAGRLIAEHGFDGFTLNQLAVAADVTVPTIHNLIGKKSELFKALVEDMITRTEELIGNQVSDDPLESVELFIDGLIDLYSTDESLYRAAFIAGDRAQLFEHEKPGGIFNKALRLAEKVCEDAVTHNYLSGNIKVGQLANQLFSCQRIARHDWMHDYTDLQAHRSQVLVGMYITLAPDANPEFHKKVMRKLKMLS